MTNPLEIFDATMTVFGAPGRYVQGPGVLDRIGGFARLMREIHFDHMGRPFCRKIFSVNLPQMKRLRRHLRQPRTPPQSRL